MAAMNEETAELIRSLKETIRAQAGELESLTEQLGKLTKERDELVSVSVGSEWASHICGFVSRRVLKRRRKTWKR
jgi:ribosomal 50S subunit-associated protein YjgA (DUF615 family)